MHDPNSRAEVCRASSSDFGVGRQSRSPYSALVSNEGTNPISSDAVSQHRIVIFDGLEASSPKLSDLPLHAEMM